jgi:predicted DCC family thiol-disulfide oxidoreductase YuxK
MNSRQQSAKASIRLIYDNDCPVCRSYSQLVRIRRDIGALELINAREDSKALQQVTDMGLDIDQGMVLIIGDSYYYGSDAIHMLSLLSSRSGPFNRLHYYLFRSRHVAKWLYPLLRACRNLLLKLLGKTKINNLGHQGDDHF